MFAVSSNSEVSVGHHSVLANVLNNSDLRLAQVVSERMPKGTYTSVNVKTLNYTFSGLQLQGVPTRVISLAVSKSQQCSAFFYAFFSGLGLINNQKLAESTDKDRLTGQILNHICETPGDNEQIKLAFVKCTDIDLYIASNLSAIEMKMRESSVVLNTFRITRFIKNDLWPLFTIIRSMSGNNTQNM